MRRPGFLADVIPPEDFLKVGFSKSREWDGPAPPSAGRMCTMQYDPVCGKDGKTYGNSCEAGNVGVRHHGKCGSPVSKPPKFSDLFLKLLPHDQGVIDLAFIEGRNYPCRESKTCPPGAKLTKNPSHLCNTLICTCGVDPFLKREIPQPKTGKSEEAACCNGKWVKYRAHGVRTVKHPCPTAPLRPTQPTEEIPTEYLLLGGAAILAAILLLRK